MKTLGKYICIIGSFAAIIIPPYKIINTVNWGFIWGDIVSVKGLFSSGKIYNYIDYQTLVIELVVINLVGLLLYFAFPAKKRKSRR